MLWHTLKQKLSQHARRAATMQTSANLSPRDGGEVEESISNPSGDDVLQQAGAQATSETGSLKCT